MPKYRIDVEIGRRELKYSFLCIQFKVDVDKNPAVVATYGPLALRGYIHPCAQQEKATVPEALFSYVDIELDFKRKHSQHADDEFKQLNEVASGILYCS